MALQRGQYKRLVCKHFLILFVLSVLSLSFSVLTVSEAQAGRFLPSGDYVDGVGDSDSSNGPVYRPGVRRSPAFGGVPYDHHCSAHLTGTVMPRFRSHQRRNDTNSREWNRSSRTEVSLEIPDCRVLVSSFTIGPEERQRAKFSYRTPVGKPALGVNLWVSDSIMGAPLSGRCDLDNAQYAYQMNVATAAENPNNYYCEVEPNKTYYIHMEHTGPHDEPSHMLRQLTTTIR